MSTVTSSILSSSASVTHHPMMRLRNKKNGYLMKTMFLDTISSSSSSSKPHVGHLLFKTSRDNAFGLKPRSTFTTSRPFSPVMEWQDCIAKIKVDIPCSVAYNCYNDREAIPHWMPFISSVKIVEGKPDLSRWSLKYEAFGRDLEFSWLARNMQPIPNQKIHWRSLDGLPNKGAVRFYPKGCSSCLIEALRPFLEGLLLRGLERFAEVAKEYQSGSSKA